jgi:outer membrane lipoprotein-sorting protein
MQFLRAAGKASVLAIALTMAVLAAAQSVPDQHQPDARELLGNVETTYSRMNTYSAKSTNVMEMSGANMQNRMETSMTIAVDSSGRFRIESTGMAGMLMVFDGTTMWSYMPQLNQYTKFSSAQALARSESAANQTESSVPIQSDEGMAMFGSSFNPLYGYRSLSSSLKDAKVLRNEKLHVNGTDVDCWVVSLEYESPGGFPQANHAHSEKADVGFNFEPAPTKTLWVDKAHCFVYQEDSTSKMTIPGATEPMNTKQTVKFDSVTVDEPISPEVFTFTPPSGATEMDTSKEIERIKALKKNPTQ